MSEGRSELENALEVWERRHAAAVRAKCEAEVVMPFLRAAVEELDGFHAGDKGGAAVVPESAAKAPGPVAVEKDSPPARGKKSGSKAADSAHESAGDKNADEDPKTFRPRGIASLMDDEDKDAKAAAV